MVDMRFLAESNGSSATRGYVSLSSSWLIPALVAVTTRAPSVGSPKHIQLPPFSWTWESLLRAPMRSRSSRSVSPRGSNLAPLDSKWPSGAYPAPETWMVLPLAVSLWTVISFLVRVPVLSLQMTVVLPRVSTEASLRTMAFCLAMRAVPRARVMVRTAGRPSGMAETARLMLVMNTSWRVLSWTNQRTMNTQNVRTTEMVASWRPIFSILTRRGGSSTSMDWTMPAILPNSLDIPVSVTTATALPPVTTVPMNTQFFLSPTPASALTRPRFLVTGRDSPVRAASSTWRFAASRSLLSAGTRLPASRRTMSPGTRSFESMDSSLPPRRTRTWGETIALRASTAFSALYSWTKPRTAFMTTMMRMTQVSVMGSPSWMER